MRFSFSQSGPVSKVREALNIAVHGAENTEEPQSDADQHLIRGAAHHVAKVLDDNESPAGEPEKNVAVSIALDITTTIQ